MSAIEPQTPAKNVKYASSVGPALGGILLIVSLCAFTAFLAAGLNGRKWEVALLVSIVASLALRAIVPDRDRLPDWYLVSCCVVIGVGTDWICAFQWFARRYAFLSGPVIGMAGLIVGLCAVIAFLVARIMRRDWRTALAVFLLASWIGTGVAERWGHLR
jgi:hypothetical protein